MNTYEYIFRKASSSLNSGAEANVAKGLFKNYVDKNAHFFTIFIIRRVQIEIGRYSRQAVKKFNTLNRQNLEKSTNTVTSLISTSYLLEQRLQGLLAHMMFNSQKIWGTKLAKSMVNVAPNLFSSNQQEQQYSEAMLHVSWVQQDQWENLKN